MEAILRLEARELESWGIYLNTLAVPFTTQLTGSSAR